MICGIFFFFHEVERVKCIQSNYQSFQIHVIQDAVTKMVWAIKVLGDRFVKGLVKGKLFRYG